MYRRYTKTPIFLLLILFSLPSNASEQNYQTDISITQSTDKYLDRRVVRKSHTLSHYFEAVKTDQVPFSEAGFVNRTGNIQFQQTGYEAYETKSHESGNISSLNFTHAQKDSSLWFNFIQGNMQLGKFIQGDATIDQTTTATTISGLGIGYYFFKNGLLSINQLERESLFTNYQIAGGVNQNSATMSNTFLRAKFVFGSLNTSVVNLELSAGQIRTRNHVSTPEENEVYGMTTDFYYSQYSSIGLHYSHTTGAMNHHKGKKGRISISLYNENGQHLEAQYEKFDAYDLNKEYDRISIKFGVYF